MAQNLKTLVVATPPRGSIMMNRQKKPRQIVYLLAMEGLANKASIWSTITPIGQVVNWANKAGYSGIEYFPIRFISALQAYTGLFTQNTAAHIQSAQQSFRSERTWEETNTHANPQAAKQAYILFPEREASLRHLINIQRCNPQVKLVVNPYHEWKGEQQYALWNKLRHRLYRTAPEHLERWEINSAQWAREVKERADGFAIDWYHMRRLPTQGFTTSFMRWGDFLPLLLKEGPSQIRVGFTSGDDKSQDELNSLYRGSTSSLSLWNMLNTVAYSDWEGQLVVQIPTDMIRTTLGIKRTILFPHEVFGFYNQVLTQIKQAFR